VPSVHRKGETVGGEESPDMLVSAAATAGFEAPRGATKHTHGTGCSLSSAIAAELAKGRTPQAAVAAAKAWLADAVLNAGALSVGAGHGPIHHFHALWTPRGPAL